MEFIGQERLIQNLTSTDARAVLVQGPAHAGKKTLIRHVFKELGLYVYEVSGSVSEFRETIEFIKNQTNPIMYLIPDVDQLHPGIQNLLLKILEEPPMRSRFCLTASNSILPTIRSRCVGYTLDPYTPEQILSLCCDSELVLAQKYAGILSKAVETPGQLYQLIGWAGYDSLEAMIQRMSEIKNNLNQPLAVVINKAGLLAKFIKDQTLSYYYFYLLAKGLYSDFESFSILSQNLNELDRYIMCYFYSELWKEVACK